MPSASELGTTRARRVPSSGSSRSTRTIRRPMHDGQNPRDLQAKGTRSSSPQVRQSAWYRPRATAAPLRFLARLVGLVPPPRQHQVRYFGVFANHHHLRERVAPQLCAALATASVQGMLFDPTGLRPWQPGTSLPQARAPARIGWASLLARVFAIDVSVCTRCNGPMRLVRAVTDVDEIATLLHGARPPPRLPTVEAWRRGAA